MPCLDQFLDNRVKLGGELSARRRQDSADSAGEGPSLKPPIDLTPQSGNRNLLRPFHPLNLLGSVEHQPTEFDSGDDANLATAHRTADQRRAIQAAGQPRQQSGSTGRDAQSLLHVGTETCEAELAAQSEMPEIAEQAREIEIEASPTGNQRAHGPVQFVGNQAYPFIESRKGGGNFRREGGV